MCVVGALVQAWSLRSSVQGETSSSNRSHVIDFDQADGDMKCPEGMNCVQAQGQIGICVSESGPASLLRVKGKEIIVE